MEILILTLTSPNSSALPEVPNTLDQDPNRSLCKVALSPAAFAATEQGADADVAPSVQAVGEALEVGQEGDEFSEMEHLVLPRGAGPKPKAAGAGLGPQG